MFHSLVLLGTAILLEGCLYGDESCHSYGLVYQDHTTNGEVMQFVYNPDKTLEVVSDLNQAETYFYYTRGGELFRIEKNKGGVPETVWSLRSDAKGRVISRYKEDHAPGDSIVFEYDDKDRMIKASYYSNKSEIFFYYDIEYPDASTVKKAVYLRDQFTSALNLSTIDIYEIDNYPLPYPQGYYFSQDILEEVFLPHNVLSKRTTSPDGATVGTVTTHTYTYNQRGYPKSQDTVLQYVYGCI